MKHTFPNPCFTALALSLALGSLLGCTTPTQYITPGAKVPITAGISDQDVSMAVSDLTSSLLASGVLNRTDGSRYILAIGRVINDSTQRFDTDILTDQITDELAASGRVFVTAAYTGDTAKTATRVDSTLDATRSLRNDDEFNQSTIVGKGKLVAATLSLSGRIYGREVPADRGTKLIDYYFRMRIVDQATGLEYWAKQVHIGKLADRRTPTW